MQADVLLIFKKHELGVYKLFAFNNHAYRFFIDALLKTVKACVLALMHDIDDPKKDVQHADVVDTELLETIDTESKLHDTVLIFI